MLYIIAWPALYQDYDSDERPTWVAEGEDAEGVHSVLSIAQEHIDGGDQVRIGFYYYDASVFHRRYGVAGTAQEAFAKVLDTTDTLDQVGLVPTTDVEVAQP